MKKILTVMAALFVAITISANQADTTQFVRNGNNFTKTYKVQSNKDTETEYTFTIGETIYPIWITPNGRCYVIRTSKKSGKQYRQYVCKEVALQICAELGIEYVENNQ